MSRQVRYRVTALVLGGLLLGAPLLTNGTASADQVEAGGRQVVFSGGGVLGLSCRSTPSVNALTVPADSTVTLVNRTGHSARVELGGASRGTVADDGATEVMFRRGTTAVTLTPTCALGNESLPLLVTAMPSMAAERPDPTPAPAGSTDVPDPTAQPADSTGAGPAVATGNGSLPDSSTSATAGQHPSTRTPSRPGASRTAASRAGAMAAATSATAAQSMPMGGSVPTRLSPRTLKTKSGGLGPAFSGMPPGDSKAIVSGVPTLSLPSVTDAGPAVAADSSPGSEAGTAEPVASLQPLPDDKPNGLLALIAIVCTLGVSIGLIRAFVSQRASRTTIA
jgi:hypothetical protein